MRCVRERIVSLSQMRVPVLIAGGRGSGRDRAVGVLHEIDRRGGRPLVVVRCGNLIGPTPLPPRGCHVYLDEVARLSPVEQGRWLEYLGLRGDVRTSRVARVYASTSHELRACVREGSFSPPLAEYLLRFTIQLPLLADRRQDIPDLVHSLMDEIGTRLERDISHIEARALQRLRAQPWPGDVAELAGVVEKLVAYSGSGEITLESLDQVLDESRQVVTTIRAELKLRRRRELIALLHDCGGNLAAAARRLGVSRSTLVSRAQRSGLLPPPRAG